MLSVLLRYTDSDYLFGIFKLFIWKARYWRIISSFHRSQIKFQVFIDRRSIWQYPILTSETSHDLMFRVDLSNVRVPIALSMFSPHRKRGFRRLPLPFHLLLVQNELDYHIRIQQQLEKTVLCACLIDWLIDYCLRSRNQYFSYILEGKKNTCTGTSQIDDC